MAKEIEKLWFKNVDLFVAGLLRAFNLLMYMGSLQKRSFSDFPSKLLSTKLSGGGPEKTMEDVADQEMGSLQKV